MDTSFRSLEFQIEQLAKVITNRNLGELPSKIEINPREYVKTISLQSCKELSEPMVKHEKRKGSDENENECEKGAESKVESHNEPIVKLSPSNYALILPQVFFHKGWKIQAWQGFWKVFKNA